MSKVLSYERENEQQSRVKEQNLQLAIVEGFLFPLLTEPNISSEQEKERKLPAFFVLFGIKEEK